ncbi:MAG TPA: hypothetical protein VFJ30_18640 [Phycisphaerae bacterium]|nr:hypothetical protein [Phycisphaerae bacterium]
MTRQRTVIVMMTAILAVGTTALAADYVWWEGERPARTNFPAKSWFSASTFPAKRDVLSKGDWLTNAGKRTGEEAFAAWRVNVPAPGEYHLWARKFWKHGPFRWRFNTGDWQSCTREVALADSADIRTHLCANWVYLGKVTLTAGEHDFELRLLAGPGEELTACFDCFLLTPRVFQPRGKLKPHQRSGAADQGFFAWEPPTDPFTADALLDLRGLNEQQAGSSGFVRRAGDDFQLGDGKGVRFWAVNVSSSNAAQDRASVDYLARRLAKAGVNMVRFHSPLFDPAHVDRLDAKKLDDLHYLIAAMKAQGIYTTISFYFPLWFEPKAAWGLPGYETTANKKAFALLFFEPRMQEIYRSWARQLLTTENPYTHLPVARDPAVAIVEIINEDSLFFWTFSEKNIPAPYMRKLEALFGQWLTRRYGSVAKALPAWAGAAHPRDDAAAGRAGLFDAWHMTRDGLRQAGAGKRKRIADQVRFLAQQQRGFYEGMARFFRDDLGHRGLVSASNWQTADAGLLDAIERHTYAACDVIDRHGYFGGPHKGDGASYSVRVGHTFADRAGVRDPFRLPIQAHQLAGRPQIISELGWTNPNRFRAEATFLAAVYGAIQGIDGIYFFAVGSNYLDDQSMAKFAVGSPVTAGTFPAAALLYRRGDVTTPPPVLRHRLNLDDLYALQGAPTAAAAALDALRSRDVPGGRPDSADFDPLAFYTGPVVRTFEQTPDPAPAGPDRFIDRKARTVRSATGQVRWDYGKGLVTVDAPNAQGAAGFLAEAGAIRLKDVTIDCRNEYAAVLVISLDGKPLAQSGRILIQAMTEERPYGFRAAGGKITDLGGAPFGVRRIDATVALTLPGPAPFKAAALDENGYPTDRPVQVSRTGPTATVHLAPDAVHHVLTR